MELRAIVVLFGLLSALALARTAFADNGFDAVRIISQAEESEREFEQGEKHPEIASLKSPSDREYVNPTLSGEIVPGLQCATEAPCECLCVRGDMTTVYTAPTRSSRKILVASKGTAFQDLGDTRGVSTAANKCGQWRRVRPTGGDEGWVQGCKVDSTGCACTCQPGRCDSRPTVSEARERCVKAVAAMEGRDPDNLSEDGRQVVRTHCDNLGDIVSLASGAETRGASQSQDKCPLYQGQECNGRGRCEDGRCKCNVQYEGEVCQWKRECSVCAAVGDTHFTTFDNLYFNFYSGEGSYGEYLAYALPGDPLGLAVSVTMPQVDAGKRSSRIKSIQVRRGGQIVKFDASEQVTLNCKHDLTKKGNDCPANGYIVGDQVQGLQIKRSGSTWTVDSPPDCAWKQQPGDNGASLGGWTSCDLHLEINFEKKMNRLAMHLGVCEPKLGDLKGVCGNNNGVGWDDVGPAGKTWRYAEPAPEWMRGFYLSGGKVSLDDCSGQFTPYFSDGELVEVRKVLAAAKGSNKPSDPAEPLTYQVATRPCAGTDGDDKSAPALKAHVEKMCNPVQKRRGKDASLQCMRALCTSLGESCHASSRADARTCCKTQEPDDGRWERYAACLEDTCNLGVCQADIFDALDADIAAFEKTAKEAEGNLDLAEANDEVLSKGYKNAQDSNALADEEFANS
eukprot:TRINITY_DN12699_c0_g1_i1.p1 TRINITY_DN12699_c0_g1~~TRINITY_DN12699_c0_g1_i1.p1  ORF type:complete len:680 (-),score=113.60 TRINITY_DN12699_c0_g1_i1:82-2121(-)